MASFWVISSTMAFMTFTLTFAGIVQTHLQRVMGMNYMEVQDQLSVFYWMRFGSGLVVVIGVLMWVYATLGPKKQVTIVPDGALAPAE